MNGVQCSCRAHLPSRTDVIDECALDEKVQQRQETGAATHSISVCRASWPIFSISSLLRRGLIVLASPSSYSSSLSSTWGLSRGIIIVPLDFRLPRRGRASFAGSGLGWSGSLTDDDDEVELMLSEGRRALESSSEGKGAVDAADIPDGSGSGAALKRGRVCVGRHERRR